MTERNVTPIKDPITCHVLDQATGRPAPSISVILTLINPSSLNARFTALTSSDGRISNWTAPEGFPSLPHVFAQMGDQEEGRTVWSLNFETGKYFGEGKTFFPEVEVRFFVEAGQSHYHVPLLLGPWSFTTYRGN